MNNKTEFPNPHYIRRYRNGNISSWDTKLHIILVVLGLSIFPSIPRNLINRYDILCTFAFGAAFNNLLYYTFYNAFSPTVETI